MYNGNQFYSRMYDLGFLKVTLFHLHLHLAVGLIKYTNKNCRDKNITARGWTREE